MRTVRLALTRFPRMAACSAQASFPAPQPASRDAPGRPFARGAGLAARPGAPLLRPPAHRGPPAGAAPRAPPRFDPCEARGQAALAPAPWARLQGTFPQAPTGLSPRDPAGPWPDAGRPRGPD